MQNPDTSHLTAFLQSAVLDCVAKNGASSATEITPQKFFDSPTARAIKQDIIAAGKKLWQRQYVDGNGGNISVRVSENLVICTPTLVSKGDLQLEDFSLVDLENNRICGTRPHTSEIRLHLEIYKTVPEARAVIHCHPPYATAHAIAGVAPPSNLIPEQEVFIGKVAVAPYETPGTWTFAETIRPFVKKHNTILLSNHGIVCWADTVNHAEWYVEIVDTYCKTALIAAQLGKTPLPEIPPDKMKDLLAIKRNMGLPDPRNEPDPNIAQKLPPYPYKMAGVSSNPALQKEIDGLISSFTSQLRALLDKHP